MNNRPESSHDQAIRLADREMSQSPNDIDAQSAKFDWVVQDLKDTFSNLRKSDDRDELTNMLEGFLYGFTQRKERNND